MSDEVSTPLADIGLEANVSAEVSDPAADESAPADPAEAAEAAAPEDEESEEEVEVNADGFPAVARSEERRVGKECRSRGSPDH